MLNKKLLFSIGAIFAFYIFALGVGGGGGGKNPPPMPQCQDLNITVSLPLNLNVHLIPNRNSAYQTFQPANNILNGGQVHSTPTPSADSEKNYCLITVTAIDCVNFGPNNSATRTFLWHANTSWTGRMSIQVPNGRFRLTIEIIEAETWYTQYPLLRRAMFRYSQTLDPWPNIILNANNFSFIGFHNSSK